MSPGFWREHRKGFIIATVAAPVLALLGALGTDQIALLPRLVYWLVLMETGALIGLGVSMLVHGWGRFARMPVLEALLISAGIALPLTLVVIAMSGIFFGMAMPGLSGFLSMFAIVLLISSVVTAINYAVQRRSALTAGLVEMPAAGVADGADLPPTAAVLPRLLDRLPPPHRPGPVLALEAEDHYLRVHTPAGSTLVLMRLSDAIAELDGVDGAQTHRSWWVARAAIARIDRGEGRATLHLASDLAVPVSRTHYRNLRKAGWF